MELLNPDLDIEGYFMRVREASERVLLLDYDGTLAPFHIDPRLALPYPRACAVLRDVIAVPGTRVVIVSGRRMEDLRAPLALIPHTEVWASHGWERATGRVVSRRIPAVDAREALRRAALLAEPLTRHGARIERKVASVAVHWRGLNPPSAARVKAGLETCWKHATQDELALLPFECGLEIRALGRSKADAVREALVDCKPGAACAYLGDDNTDEDAFRAIRPLGLPVLVRETHRRTEADLWLSHPRELTAFLERWRPAARAS